MSDSQKSSSDLATDNSCDTQQTLLAINDVLKILQDKAVAVSAVETVSILKARTRILAEDLTSSINVPPADNSAMDGYVFNAADIERQLSNSTTTSLEISQRICA